MDLGGVVALVQIPVELLKETVIMMMNVKVISYVAKSSSVTPL